MSKLNKQPEKTTNPDENKGIKRERGSITETLEHSNEEKFSQLRSVLSSDITFTETQEINNILGQIDTNYRQDIAIPYIKAHLKNINSQSKEAITIQVKPDGTHYFKKNIFELDNLNTLKLDLTDLNNEIDTISKNLKEGLSELSQLTYEKVEILASEISENFISRINEISNSNLKAKTIDLSNIDPYFCIERVATSYLSLEDNNACGLILSKLFSSEDINKLIFSDNFQYNKAHEHEADKLYSSLVDLLKTRSNIHLEININKEVDFNEALNDLLYEVIRNAKGKPLSKITINGEVNLGLNYENSTYFGNHIKKEGGSIVINLEPINNSSEINESELPANMDYYNPYYNQIDENEFADEGSDYLNYDDHHEWDY